LPGQARTIRFGRVEIVPQRGEVLVDGSPAAISGRAYDILMVLAEAKGALVTKDELMRRVWPTTVVEESSLYVHMSALRRALGDDRAAIRTVSGRGYRLIVDAAASPDLAAAAAAPAPISLPAPATDLLGRDAALAELAGLAAEHRIVTLAGAGGIGKTRLALALAHDLLPQFPDGAGIVELAPLARAELVPAAVAATCGLELGAAAASPEQVAQALRGRRLLLVLDTCEHVIDVAAVMAEALVRAGPHVRVIATTREPLRSQGERVYRVPPLDVPGADQAGDVLQHGATALFVARARAVDASFAVDARSAALIGAVCRRLDGIPLAIELAASRAATLGVQAVAARLDDRFALLTGGHRTALPRHQTLRATLDWSYDLLSADERAVLRRLGLFAGGFTLEAARAVAADEAAQPRLTASDVVDAVMNLIAKSLVAVDLAGAAPRYRLLDTTRAYARERLAESGELHAAARRHAAYYRDLLARAQAEWKARLMGEWLTAYRRELDDVRAALDWAFAADGDTATGVALALTAAPLMYELSLIEESLWRAEHALAALAREPVEDAAATMQLRAAQAAALMYARGPTPATSAAWSEVLAIATRLGEREYQARALWGLWTTEIYRGAPRTALQFAEQFMALTQRHGHVGQTLLAHRAVGIALHYLGDQAGARRHIETMLARYDRNVHTWHTLGFRVDHALVARATLVRILWLQGHVDQAVALCHRIADEAEAYGHPLSTCYVLVEGAILVLQLAGELEATQPLLATLLHLSAQHGFAIWNQWGRCFEATLMMRMSLAHPEELAASVARMQIAVDALREGGYGAHFPILLVSLAKGLEAAGHFAEALNAAEEGLAYCARNEERWCVAELLRTKGEIVLRLDGPDAASDAAALFAQSLALAREHGALSWELRGAASLARLQQRHGRGAAARATLAPVHARFTEGFATVDLKAATALLASLPPTD
jgi:predicted ATPase/DNA-binding winged helix-turn-helix (wHTH) protein